VNLNNTSTLLQVVLGEAINTSQVQVSVVYTDMLVSGSFNNGPPRTQAQRANSNGVTATTVCAAPGTADVDRKVNRVCAYNADVIAHVVTLQIYDGTTAWKQQTMTVPANDSLHFEEGVGWYLGSSRTTTVVSNTVATGLTALAGGAQAGTALTADINVFETVASANDSAQLPAATAGRKDIIVQNLTATAMKVFPQTGEAIGTAAANAGVAIAANKSARFFCGKAATWGEVLSG
jgi:hypothetical protein